MGDPTKIMVGPGQLYIAPLGTDEPTDLTTAWDSDWVPLGYTHEGSEFSIENSFGDVMVAEELEPVLILQTQRLIKVTFEMAEITAENLRIAFNGGTITTNTGYVTFTPPPAGDATPVMLGWQADDGGARWVFRKCIQTGNVTIANRKAPDKATIPVEFRCMRPDASTAPLVVIRAT